MNTEKQLESLPWNIVTRNLHGHALLRKKIWEKITKLEKHLKHFPTGTVQVLENIAAIQARLREEMMEAKAA